jgi:hypothetical protein
MGDFRYCSGEMLLIVEILSSVFLSLFVIVVDSGGNTCCKVEIIPTTPPQIPPPFLFRFRLQFLSGGGSGGIGVIFG